MGRRKGYATLQGAEGDHLLRPRHHGDGVLDEFVRLHERRRLQVRRNRMRGDDRLRHRAVHGRLRDLRPRHHECEAYDGEHGARRRRHSLDLREDHTCGDVFVSAALAADRPQAQDRHDDSSLPRDARVLPSTTAARTPSVARTKSPAGNSRALHFLKKLK